MTPSVDIVVSPLTEIVVTPSVTGGGGLGGLGGGGGVGGIFYRKSLWAIENGLLVAVRADNEVGRGLRRELLADALAGELIGQTEQRFVGAGTLADRTVTAGMRDRVLWFRSGFGFVVHFAP